MKSKDFQLTTARALAISLTTNLLWKGSEMNDTGLPSRKAVSSFILHLVWPFFRIFESQLMRFQGQARLKHMSSFGWNSTESFIARFVLDPFVNVRGFFPRISSSLHENSHS